MAVVGGLKDEQMRIELGVERTDKQAIFERVGRSAVFGVVHGGAGAVRRCFEGAQLLGRRIGETSGAGESGW